MPIHSGIKKGLPTCKSHARELALGDMVRKGSMALKLTKVEHVWKKIIAIDKIRCWSLPFVCVSRGFARGGGVVEGLQNQGTSDPTLSLIDVPFA